MSLQAGQEFTIGAKAVPDTATYKELAYRSSDESIATVDEEGIITAIAPGEAEIVITAHGNVTLHTSDCHGGPSRRHPDEQRCVPD
ncbi:MAG: Ig domain-containing protein [Clostridia bacterium]